MEDGEGFCFWDIRYVQTSVGTELRSADKVPRRQLINGEGLRRRCVDEPLGVQLPHLRPVLEWKALCCFLSCDYVQTNKQSHCSILHEDPRSISFLKGECEFPSLGISQDHPYPSANIFLQNFQSGGFQSFFAREEIFPYIYLCCNIISPLGMKPWQVFQDACPEERR